jgi:spore coat polysaccharide biosynthesis protein SpsF
LEPAAVILGILQARTGSTRLPGKVLMPLLGEPMIVRELERLAQASTLDALVVATSTDPSDDELAATVAAAGVDVRRGSLDDVLGRFLQVVDEYDPDVVVRLTADNPLTDPDVLDLIVRTHLESGADYTSNAIERSYPRGLDVEAVEADALRAMRALGPDAEEREHVTIGIYRRPETFRLQAVTQQPDRSDLRWTVDEPEDFAFAERVYQALYPANPAFRQADVLALLEREPGLRRTEPDAGT